jgi:hypothetical protein
MLSHVPGRPHTKVLGEPFFGSPLSSWSSTGEEVQFPMGNLMSPNPAGEVASNLAG